MDLRFFFGVAHLLPGVAAPQPEAAGKGVAGGDPLALHQALETGEGPGVGVGQELHQGGQQAVEVAVGRFWNGEKLGGGGGFWGAPPSPIHLAAPPGSTLQEDAAAAPRQQRCHLHGFPQAGAGVKRGAGGGQGTPKYCPHLPGGSPPPTPNHGIGVATPPLRRLVTLRLLGVMGGPRNGVGGQMGGGRIFRVGFSPAPQNCPKLTARGPASASPPAPTATSPRAPRLHRVGKRRGGSGQGEELWGVPPPPQNPRMSPGEPQCPRPPLTVQAERPQLEVGELDVGQGGQLGGVGQHARPAASTQQSLQAPGWGGGTRKIYPLPVLSSGWEASPKPHNPAPKCSPRIGGGSPHVLAARLRSRVEAGGSQQIAAARVVPAQPLRARRGRGGGQGDTPQVTPPSAAPQFLPPAPALTGTRRSSKWANVRFRSWSRSPLGTHR